MIETETQSDNSLLPRVKLCEDQTVLTQDADGLCLDFALLR